MNLERGPQRLPDLYSLLGLEPLEADRGVIEQALKRLLARAKQAEKAQDQPAVKRAARILELGKKNLLQPQRKKLYDEQWRRVHGSPAAAAAAPAVWDYSELQPLLPAGDPQQEFDLGKSLRLAAQWPEPDYEADFAKLQGVLSSLGTAGAASQPAAEQLVDAKRADAMLVTESAEVAAEVARPQATSALAAVVARDSGRPRSLAAQMRKKRERSLLLAVGGLLASLAIVLGFVYLMLPDGKGPPSRAPTLAQTQPAGAQEDGAKPPAAVRRSGLPQVRGLEGSPDTGQANPMESLRPGRDGQAVGETATSSAAPAAAPIGEVPARTSSAAAENAGGAGVTTGATPPATVSPQVPAASVPQLSQADQAEWQTLLVDIRQLLGKQDYAQAASKLQVAEDKAQTGPQQEQLARWTTLASLARDFHTAMSEAIGGMSAGETFVVGRSTQASLVEGGAQHLVVRIRGQNQRFALTELPIGLAYAVADLRLDLESPLSLAKKAAFTLVHPPAANNELALRRAQSLMSQAIAGGAVAQDMMAVFGD
ncbi:MAG: hypothetical protein KDA45_12005 [Planctomycetales bacterium]|nr:hypothetical protein [Planctomycetales bacterium]